MSGALTVFCIGVIAAGCLGIADFFGARASKTISPVTAAFAIQTVGTLGFLLWYVLDHAGIPSMQLTSWVYTLGGALLMGAGMCTLYLAFERGPVCLASPLSSAYPLVNTGVGVVFFGAAVTPTACVAVVVVVLGVMAASGLFGVEKRERKIGAGARLALLTTLLWGLAYPMLGQAISLSGWRPVTLIQLLAMVPILGVLLIFRREPELLTSRLVARTLRNPLVTVAGVLQTVAILAINIGFGLGQAAGAIVVATSAAYPAITMLLALRKFDERADAVGLAGAGLTMAGVVALHTF